MTVVESQPQRRSLLAPQSLAVELTAGVLVVACFAHFGFGGRAFVASFVVAVLVVLSAVDIERQILPNRILFRATVVVLGAQLLLFPDHALEWVLAAVGASLFLLLAFLAFRGGLGLGDVKLAFLLGAALGKSVAAALLVGTAAAALFGVTLLLREGAAARRKAIPFGPFLAVGAVVALLLDVRVL